MHPERVDRLERALTGQSQGTGRERSTRPSALKSNTGYLAVASDCTRLETPIQWNQTGPRGPQASQGIRTSRTSRTTGAVQGPEAECQP